MPFARLEVKSRRCGQLRFSKSARRGSKKGTSPARNLASLASSTSMHMTLVPESAKQAPATNPTNPEPTTAIFTRPLVPRLRVFVEHFVEFPRQIHGQPYVPEADWVASSGRLLEARAFAAAAALTRSWDYVGTVAAALALRGLLQPGRARTGAFASAAPDTAFRARPPRVAAGLGRDCGREPDCSVVGLGRCG